MNIAKYCTILYFEFLVWLLAFWYFLSKLLEATVESGATLYKNACHLTHNHPCSYRSFCTRIYWCSFGSTMFEWVREMIITFNIPLPFPSTLLLTYLQIYMYMVREGASNQILEGQTGKKSLICLKGKSMAPYRWNTFLLRSFSYCIVKGFLSWLSILQGPPTSTRTLLQNYKDTGKHNYRTILCLMKPHFFLHAQLLTP